MNILFLPANGMTLSASFHLLAHAEGRPFGKGTVITDPGRV